MYYTLLALLILSRLFFINTQDVFFDSGENIGLFANSIYFQALVSGHFPPHIGYILIFWPVFQLASFLHVDPVLSVILGQILLSTLTIVCFYKAIKFLVDKHTALFASIIASLLPLFWITNVTIMMELGYISLFFFSFFFLIKYFSNSKKQFYIYISALCFTLSFLTHMLTILWLPLLLVVIYYKRKAEFTKILLTFFSYLVFGSIFKILFISMVSKENISAVFYHLYLTKSGEFANLSFDIKSFLIMMRNFLIPLVRNNTSLIFILGILSLLVSFRKNKKVFIFGVLWIAPAIYANQWWDSLLNGRHALIASFGLAFLIAHLIREKFLFIFVVIIYLLYVSIPTLNLLRQPIPYLLEAEFVKTLPENSLFIETHFARPQVQEIKSLKFFFVNEPGFNKNNLSKQIDKYINEGKQVFISSGALSEPYGLYSGPYLHNITLSYAKTFELEPITKNYTLEKYKEINIEDNLIIYKIISRKPSPYPKIIHLKNSHRRIDYHDPLASFVRRLLPQ